MKNTVRLNEEISKDVKVKKHVTTKIEYFCENDNDCNTICDNINRVLTKNLAQSDLAKITYDLDESEHKVVVEIIEHVSK